LIPVKVVILAGGQGTRFWPKSRMKAPKQFLSISPDGESLIQATARRVKPLADNQDLWIVTNCMHTEKVAEHVPYARIISEPVGRNTTASIGLAAMFMRVQSPNDVMVILPADHAVKQEEILLKALNQAVKVASEKDVLVTIGVTPAYPHTGYGYIKRGEKLNGGPAFSVSRFFEKPNFERAQEYCKNERFYWNSGMFVWRPEVILTAIKNNLPRLYEGLEKIAKFIGTSDEARALNEIFPELESISIDFGVLEHARNCAVVPAEPFGWNDVGSWDAWAEHFASDAEGNLSRGDVMTIDSQGCIVYGHDRLIAVLGAQDLVVIDSGDAMLVCPRNRVQDVKNIVEELKRRGRTEMV
jgi:mannose-1-phosphate guanylyltransferase